MALMRKEDADFDVLALNSIADMKLTTSEIKAMVSELSESINEKQKTLRLLQNMLGRLNRPDHKDGHTNTGEGKETTKKETFP